MDEADDLLTAPEIARAVGRNVNTVRAWVWAGRLKPAGQKWRGKEFVPAFRLSDARALDATAPRTQKNARGAKGVKPPGTPTSTRPGSEERIAVYAARVARGEALFHDDDTRLTGDVG